jgi:flagellar biosynthesis protein FliR
MIEIPLIASISAFLTIGVRLSGLMLFAPFFGSVVIPVPVKAILVFALTVLLFPVIGHQIMAEGVRNWPWMVFTEFLIGAGMGIVTNLVFDAVQLAGQVLGVQLGYSLINILDPQTEVNTTVVATFYQSLILLIFLRLDVQYWLLRAVGNSFLYLPPGTMHLSGSFTQQLVRTVGDIFGLGVQIAAPVLAATLVTDIVLGLLGKAAPQLPLILLGPAVKTLLGFTILIATIKYWPDLFQRLFLDTLSNTEHLLHAAAN